MPIPTSTAPQVSAIDVGWRRPAALLWLAGMVAFDAIWVVLGLINDGYTLFDTVIEGYSAVHQPISGLGLGSTATAMNTAFIAYGLVSLVGAAATSVLVASAAPSLRWPTLITFGMHGTGSILVGAFTLESMALHSLGFMLVLAPIVGFVVIGRRLTAAGFAPIGRLLVRVAGPLSALLVIAFFVSFNPDAAGEGRGVAGLTQRLLIVDLELWIAAIVAFAHRHGR